MRLLAEHVGSVFSYSSSSSDLVIMDILSSLFGGFDLFLKEVKESLLMNSQIELLRKSTCYTLLLKSGTIIF